MVHFHQYMSNSSKFSCFTHKKACVDIPMLLNHSTVQWHPFNCCTLDTKPSKTGNQYIMSNCPK